MNTLISALQDDFWHQVVATLHETCSLRPTYWVGENRGARRFDGCFYQTAWNAFSLANGMDIKTFRSKTPLNEITREEYFNYLKILDRADSQDNFSFSQRDDLFKRHLEYWGAVLQTQNISTIIFSNTPHLLYDYPIYLISKQRGIKTIILNTTSIRGWHYITEKIGAPPLVEVGGKFDQKTIKKEFIDPFSLSSHCEPWYMNKHKSDHNGILKKLLTTPFISQILLTSVSAFNSATGKRRGIKESFYLHGKPASIKHYKEEYSTVHKTSIFKYSRILTAGYRKIKLLKKEYDEEKQIVDLKALDYLYFPLHYQPELTTAPLGGDSADQFFAIREISKSLPEGIRLVVKEHPSQFYRCLWGHQGRNLGDYRRLRALENVIISELRTPSTDLIEQSIGVITVTGTVGWEAIINGKPCVALGDSWYNIFPIVIKCKIENIKDAIDKLMSSPPPPPPSEHEIYNTFVRNAQRNDIHGYFKGEITRNPTLLAGYIEKALRWQTHSTYHDTSEP